VGNARPIWAVESKDRQHVLWERYIDEIVVGKDDRTDKQWAEDNGTTDRTVRRWRTNSRFNDMLNERMAAETFTPEKRFAIIDNLMSIASEGHDAQAVSAAKLGVDLMDRYSPPPTATEAPAEFEEMSVAELLEVARALDPAGDIGEEK